MRSSKIQVYMSNYLGRCLGNRTFFTQRTLSCHSNLIMIFLIKSFNYYCLLFPKRSSTKERNNFMNYYDIFSLIMIFL